MMFLDKTGNEKAFILAGDLDRETVGEGVERKIQGYDDHMMMVCVRFEKGALGNLHQHRHRQITYVASGSFEVTIDGRNEILKAGDSFFVAPELLRGVVALEKGILVDVFTPCREDFL